MKKKFKILIGIIIFIAIVSFLSDWGNFKSGLFGKAPIEKVQE